MVIKEIIVRQLELPLTKPYKVSFRTYTEFEPIVVEIVAEDGQNGWGEAYIPAGSTFETIDSAWQFCTEHAEKLVGKTASESHRIIDRQVPSAPFAACAILSALAMLTRNTALVTEKEARIPLLVPVSGVTASEIAQEIEARLEQGYRAFKVKVGWDVDKDLERVRMVQDAAGDRGTLTIDANRGYDQEQGMRFAAALDPRGIALFEQPCEADQWQANAAVARVSTVPLMLDESIRNETDIDRAATIDGIKFVKLKLKRVGGVERALSAMQRAREKGLGICLGDGVATEILCWIEACVSRGYLSHAGDMNGFLKPKTRLLANPLLFEQGSIVLKPGYWPEMDRGILRAQQVRQERIVATMTA
ncbi:MAG: enolase C-terminal domain-like protein [Pseudomonadota bacterium]